MATTKTKKIDESVNEPKKRKAAALVRRMENRREFYPENEVNSEMNSGETFVPDYQTANLKEQCCERPLIREFNSIEGFGYSLAYGGCMENCGNTQEKFSVHLNTKCYTPIGVGTSQCVCVKSPILTGTDGSPVICVDVEIGTNQFPVGELMKYLEKNNQGNINGLVSALLTEYVRALKSLNLGLMLDGIDEPYFDAYITDVCKDHFICKCDCRDVRYELARLNSEARFEFTACTNVVETLEDNVLFIALGMDFVRQFMAAVNIALNLQSSSILPPVEIISIFKRNMRYEISGGYYPDALDELIEYVRGVLQRREECNEEFNEEGRIDD